MDVHAWLMVALGGLSSFTGALIWWILKHLQADIDKGRELTTDRDFWRDKALEAMGNTDKVLTRAEAKPGA